MLLAVLMIAFCFASSVCALVDSCVRPCLADWSAGAKAAWLRDCHKRVNGSCQIGFDQSMQVTNLTVGSAIGWQVKISWEFNLKDAMFVVELRSAPDAEWVVFDEWLEETYLLINKSLCKRPYVRVTPVVGNIIGETSNEVRPEMPDIGTNGGGFGANLVPMKLEQVEMINTSYYQLTLNYSIPSEISSAITDIDVSDFYSNRECSSLEFVGMDYEKRTLTFTSKTPFCEVYATDLWVHATVCGDEGTYIGFHLGEDILLSCHNFSVCDVVPCSVDASESVTFLTPKSQERSCQGTNDVLFTWKYQGNCIPKLYIVSFEIVKPSREVERSEAMTFDASTTAYKLKNVPLTSTVYYRAYAVMNPLPQVVRNVKNELSEESIFGGDEHIFTFSRVGCSLSFGSCSNKATLIASTLVPVIIVLAISIAVLIRSSNRDRLVLEDFKHTKQRGEARPDDNAVNGSPYIMMSQF